ncbi:SGNH/GDSL hydrolase family protein [Enterococcus aquimarinus]|uniref:SGNH hydrolase-type esterase domain-containing protein n=1 Tax=Enterococcus aquimarinus TaxID=328396 RepID=A0A1L8QT06_9ENTE|nr:SGNH/GDSL hydrolase family protein [Enterococcus aquimarinus]OJG10619.1 hypothetical protein RU93_GL002135 [Enterococcus aquimarinus]
MTESTSEYKKRIEEIKQSIENEPYMAKMREDIAEGISKTGIRQATVEEQFQAVIDETTGKDVISAPEVIVARDGAQTLGERLDSEKAEVSAQLAQKASKDELNALGELKFSGEYNTLSDLQNAYPTGSEGVFLVIADGFVYRWDGSTWIQTVKFQSDGIADNSVTPDKVYKDAVSVLSEDLSEGNLIVGKYVINGGENTYQEGILHGVTDYIPVYAGETIKYWAYTTRSNDIGALYDVDKVYTELLNPPDTAPGDAEIIIPSDGFIRVNFNNGQLDQFYVRRVIDSFALEWLELKKSNFSNYSVELSVLAQEVLDEINKPADTLADGVVTLPKLSQSVLDFIAQPTSDPYNPFDDLTSTFVGDSITQGVGTTSIEKRYSRVIAATLSMATPQTLGTSGSTIAKRVDETIKSFVTRVCDENQITSGQDFIFNFGGLNDFANDIPLTSMNESLEYYVTNGSWNEYEFFGSLHRIITYIRDNHPLSNLIFITPIHYEKENNHPNQTQGLKLLDYVKAIREVCEYYGVPIIDLFADLPLDPKNATHKAVYTRGGNGEPDGTHPSDAGNDLIARKVINYLKYQYVITS